MRRLRRYPYTCPTSVTFNGGEYRVDLAEAEDRGLTSRQLEYLTHLSLGKTARAIAYELYVTEKTVEFHGQRTKKLFDVASSPAAVHACFAYGVFKVTRHLPRKSHELSYSERSALNALSKGAITGREAVDLAVVEPMMNKLDVKRPTAAVTMGHLTSQLRAQVGPISDDAQSAIDTLENNAGSGMPTLPYDELRLLVDTLYPLDCPDPEIT